MTIKVGDKIPESSLMTMTGDGPQKLSTSDIFSGKKVAIFAVPGAFTPGCSRVHLPGYVDKANDIKSKGVDTVACVAVNDAFVMDAWGKDQNTGDKVQMFADGGGDFTRALGLEMDGSGFGLGMRSLRYSMLVDDGVVKELNLEPNPGEIKASAAEAMLEQL